MPQKAQLDQDLQVTCDMLWSCSNQTNMAAMKPRTQQGRMTLHQLRVACTCDNAYQGVVVLNFLHCRFCGQWELDNLEVVQLLRGGSTAAAAQCSSPSY